MKTFLLLYSLMCVAFGVSAQSTIIQGVVRDAQTFEGLPSATVRSLSGSLATTTDHSGNFSLTLPTATQEKLTLITSFVGYQSDTLALSPSPRKITILLTSQDASLQEVVVVSGTLKEVSKMDSPIPVEIYTPALFQKNPAPTIFESLSMINGVQPQLNCNVCNTGDIHINGMEGPYTMVLIDGMPIVSSLATVYGLSGIPNSMVKRIEVVKGPASTLYGSEAVAGLINIITKEPGTSPLFHLDVSATSLLEYNADVTTKFSVGKSTSLLGVNYFNFRNRIDINEDNFTDITQQDRLSLFNKWNFSRKDSKNSSLAFRYVYEDRWGGELQWNRNLRGSDDVYGESIYTNRFEFIGNHELRGKEKFAFDYSYNYHLQDSYYGTVKYFANQHVGFTQLRWNKTLGKHDLVAGLPFRYIRYDDNTPGTMEADGLANAPMNTYLPGIFLQDEFSITQRTTLLSGLRYDRHNEHGNIFSPRVSIKYSPNRNHTFRLSSGNGFRVVNLFTEDHAALTGARQVIIQNELKPEQSWNVNLNYATTVAHSTGFINLDVSGFYTYFTNKIVGDFLTDPELILYDNLRGHAISKGVTLNADMAFTNSFKLMTGVTLMDVYQVSNEDSGERERTPQLFAPRVSGTYALSYYLDRHQLTIDLTGRLNGPMELPVVPDDFRPSRSPWFTIMNIQVSKKFTGGFEVYAGAKNLLNFIPKDPLLRPFDPFDKNITIDNPNGYTFDASYNYAPIQGIKGFGGVRYTLQ